jgi:hypothetical protein
MTNGRHKQAKHCVLGAWDLVINWSLVIGHWSLRAPARRVVFKRPAGFFREKLGRRPGEFEKRRLQMGGGILPSLVVHWHQKKQNACYALDRPLKLWSFVRGLRAHQFRAVGDFYHSPPVFGLGLIQARAGYST